MSCQSTCKARLPLILVYDLVCERTKNLVACCSVSCSYRARIALESYLNRARIATVIGPLDDAFVGHPRQRHDVIGCSETRTVGAQSVRTL